MNSPATPADVARPSQRPFDVVMITMSAALLVIFGVVIGRFLVTNEAVQVVDHVDSQLASLRAELVQLHQEVVSAQAKAEALETVAAQEREQARLQQERADRLANQYAVLKQAVAGIAEQRATCLEEVQQYVALNQSVPAIDVYHFADAMFDAHRRTLDQIDSAEPSSAATPTLPRLSVSTASVNDSVTNPGPATVTQSSNRSTRYAEYPSLPSPEAVEPTPTIARPQSRSGFFHPPQPRPQPSRYMFFTPGGSQPQLTMPGSGNITFHETADATDTVRR